MSRKRGVQTDKTPSEDRSAGSALKGIEARRPPLPGTRWPSRRLPEAEGPLTFWRPGNVVGPQRPPGTSSLAPRPTIFGVRRRCRSPSRVQHNPIRRGQHATTCYVFRIRQKFGEPGFRRKLMLNNNLRLFLPRLSWEAPVGLTLCRYRSYVDTIHVADFKKTAFSTPFRGVLAPSGPQISAESGRATPSLAPGKPGWPPMSTPCPSGHYSPAPRPTPHAPRQTSGGRSYADPPRWLLPSTDRRIVKDRTGPDRDERPAPLC